MPKYIAFLRAINVGGHTVKMEYLRGLLETLGLVNVETFIASGNVIFDSNLKSAAALEAKLEYLFHQGLNYEVKTFIRSPKELAAIAAYQPFSEIDLKTPDTALYVAFLGDKPSEEGKQKLASFNSDLIHLHVHGREVYVLWRGKISESKFSGARLEKALGMPATMRNSTTVKKIAFKYS